MKGAAAEALERFDRALVELAAVEADDLGEFAVAMQQRLSRVDAVATRAAGAFDANGDTENARSSAIWLAYRCHLPKWKAKRCVSNARALRHMPEVDAAFAAGDINTEHVSKLAAARATDPEAFVKAEEDLVHEATALRFDQFSRRITYWQQEVAEDDAETKAQTQFDTRHAHSSKTFEDAVVVDAVFDKVGGAIWQNELDRLTDLLFKADWAEAKAMLGRDPYVHELERTPAQRRLDAMVLMATRSAAKPENAVEARVLLQVLVGYETFAGRICELADGTVLTPGQVVSVLDHADVQRVVFGSPSCVIDVGAKQRLFKGATRTAVQLRDLECRGDPSCDVRFPDCEVDHLQPNAWGGPTVQANGGLKCTWHHRQRRAP
jgi:hypothetical protein